MDNQVVDQAVPAGWEVAMLLLGGFRSMVDAVHESLAARGHPDARPAHGFALQAVGDGATATEVGRRLGVSKQAAAKTLGALERAGYVERRVDHGDARRRVVVPTRRGRDLLEASAAAFEEVVERWRAAVGAPAVDALAETLLGLGADRSARLDLGAWSS